MGVIHLAAGCLLVLVAACTGQDQPATRASSATPSALPRTSDPVELRPEDFTADIDHRYWPMEARRRWVYEETTGEGELLRAVVTVTSATKRLANGVTARVVRDTVMQDGDIIEDTVDWYAQDRAGNVWYLGEDTAEFDNGRVTSREGSFQAGVDGALPGVILPAHPTAGMAYRQEYYEGKAEDNGQVLSTQEMADVRAGHFEDSLLTKDTITIEPNVLEYKLYAPGIGPVLTLGVSGGTGREELVERTMVSPQVAKAAGVAPLGTPYG